ncbi:MAG: hypothetical protein NT027_01545 [Proteobacteria bacterium]|nr:hypothetical protein [Pseudomonadota bacterium]
MLKFLVFSFILSFSFKSVDAHEVKGKLNPVAIKGQFFFCQTEFGKNQFGIRGVSYMVARPEITSDTYTVSISSHYAAGSAIFAEKKRFSMNASIYEGVSDSSLRLAGGHGDELDPRMQNSIAFVRQDGDPLNNRGNRKYTGIVHGITFSSYDCEAFQALD